MYDSPNGNRMISLHSLNGQYWYMILDIVEGEKESKNTLVDLDGDGKFDKKYDVSYWPRIPRWLRNKPEYKAQQILDKEMPWYKGYRSIARIHYQKNSWYSFEKGEKRKSMGHMYQSIYWELEGRRIGSRLANGKFVYRKFVMLDDKLVSYTDYHKVEKWPLYYNNLVKEYGQPIAHKRPLLLTAMDTPGTEHVVFKDGDMVAVLFKRDGLVIQMVYQPSYHEFWLKAYENNNGKKLQARIYPF